MGIETEHSFKRTEFNYQNIYDNVTLLSDEMVKEINSIVFEFGHGEVLKKKETAALRLKTDSLWWRATSTFRPTITCCGTARVNALMPFVFLWANTTTCWGGGR